MNLPGRSAATLSALERVEPDRMLYHFLTGAMNMQGSKIFFGTILWQDSCLYRSAYYRAPPSLDGKVPVRADRCLNAARPKGGPAAKYKTAAPTNMRRPCPGPPIFQKYPRKFPGQKFPVMKFPIKNGRPYYFKAPTFTDHGPRITVHDQLICPKSYPQIMTLT